MASWWWALTVAVLMAMRTSLMRTRQPPPASTTTSEHHGGGTGSGSHSHWSRSSWHAQQMVLVSGASLEGTSKHTLVFDSPTASVSAVAEFPPSPLQSPPKCPSCSPPVVNRLIVVVPGPTELLLLSSLLPSIIVLGSSSTQMVWVLSGDSLAGSGVGKRA